MSSLPPSVSDDTRDARALWLDAPGRACLRPLKIAATDGAAVVETLFSAISRGTEALVAAGRVPPAEYARMRAPLQEGDFPFPVKYGYAAVGRVASGPLHLVGRTVFCLHPHQDRFAAPTEMLVPVPDTVPPPRAIMAANMETALNIVWDAGIAPGDRVAVIGAGMVGSLVGWLAARIAATEVTLVDPNAERAPLAASLGCGFAVPQDAPVDCDVVVHASATEDGLATALNAAGTEAVVVEASWFGEDAPRVPLGEAFHSRRLTLRSSQVGRVSPMRRPRWDTRRRLATAMTLLADDRLDALVSGETRFLDLPEHYAGILADPATLCHRVRYR